ncbi:CrcB-like protein, partial [Glonium stellatum]
SAISRKNTATTDQSRSRPHRHEEDEYTIPDNYENLNEFAGPSPVENPKEGNLYRHRSLEQERSKSRDARRSRRASMQQGPSGRRNASMSFGPEQNLSEKRRVSRFATQLYTVSYLIVFSMLGTLARLGLQWLTFYPGAPVVTGVLWANFAGTLFMGFLAEDRRLFRDEWGNGIMEGKQRLSDEETLPEREAAVRAAHVKVKKTIPLYIGLATGFCGSFTSFSSFMRDVFFALSNNLPTPIDHQYPSSSSPVSTTSTVSRNGGYSFMALLAVITLTLSLCLAGLKLGAHIAILLDPLTPTFPFVLLRKILDRVVVFVALGAWLGAILMAVWPPDRPSGPDSKGSWANETWRGQAVLALVFAPAGCLLRFYASLKLNGITPSFPLGTFAVNIFGTAVLGMAFDLQHVGLDNTAGVGGGRVGCQVLQGVMDGFCGCLTTVSTWIAELNGLRRRHAYVYGGVSVLSGLGILIIIMGSVRWTVGWGKVACVT